MARYVIRYRKSSSNFSNSNRRRRVCTAKSTPSLKCAGISEPYSQPVWLALSNDALVSGGRCITGTVSGRFSRSEESCLVNCVDRFLDTSLFIVKKIEEQNKSQ